MGPSAVVLMGARAEVLSREELPGDLTRHAAEVPVRHFEVLLDADPPRVRALGESDFPYRVAVDEIGSAPYRERRRHDRAEHRGTGR